MNLELLFWAAAHLDTSAASSTRRLSVSHLNSSTAGTRRSDGRVDQDGDGRSLGSVGGRSLSGRLSGAQLRAIAISHLDKTLLNHFRPDGKILTIMAMMMLDQQMDTPEGWTKL